MLESYGFTYILIASILFFAMFMVWTKKDWLNFIIKVIFFAMGVGGIIILCNR